LSIAGAIALAVIPRGARGDGAGVIAASGSESDRGAVAEAMAAAVAETKPPRVVADAVALARGAVAAGAVPIEQLSPFRHVRDIVDEGWRAYLRVSFELAQARLAAARTEAEALVALQGGSELYADVSLRLGIVLAQLGRTADAQAALALALALDPDRPITLAEFSPEVVAMVEAARVRTPAVRDVAIASEPPGAIVSVDGKQLGPAPLHASLALGQHVIVARAPLHFAAAQAIAIGEASGDVALALEPDPAALPLADGARIGLADPGAQELVDAVLRFAELDEVVVVADSDRRGGGALLVQRCAGTPARCTAIVELGYGARDGLPAAARAAWQAVRAADLRYPPGVLGDPRVAGERPVRRCELCRSPWLWSSVGAAAVLGTIAVIAIVSSSRPSPTVGIDPGRFVGP
jgi:hypothetical protein